MVGEHRAESHTCVCKQLSFVCRETFLFLFALCSFLHNENSRLVKLKTGIISISNMFPDVCNRVCFQREQQEIKRGNVMNVQKQSALQMRIYKVKKGMFKNIHNSKSSDFIEMFFSTKSNFQNTRKCEVRLGVYTWMCDLQSSTQWFATAGLS